MKTFPFLHALCLLWTILIVRHCTMLLFCPPQTFVYGLAHHMFPCVQHDGENVTPCLLLPCNYALVCALIVAVMYPVLYAMSLSASKSRTRRKRVNEIAIFELPVVLVAVCGLFSMQLLSVLVPEVVIGSIIMYHARVRKVRLP